MEKGNLPLRCEDLPSCRTNVNFMEYEQETRVVEAARGGSHEAFAQILRLHQAQVRAFLSRYVQDDDVIDDLAQETFLNAYRSMGSYKAESSLRTWLLSIARHMALRHLEDLQRRLSHETQGLRSRLAGWMARRVQAGYRVEQEQEVAALDECLEKLSAGSANLVAQYYYKGRRAPEIARTLGKSEGAVWMSLFRIRQALGDCVQTRVGGRMRHDE
jgi:RNA polymerase sigma-70 factor (ECF subfamily)